MAKVKDFVSANLYTIIAVVLLLVLAASLIPIFAISVYNYPSRDDYFLGYNVYKAHGTFFETIRSAYERAVAAYNTWQGIFTVNFIIALMPAAFGTQYYFITTLVGVLPLIAGTYFFAYQLLVKVLKTTKIKYLIISTLYLIIFIQFMPSPAQGFYWYASVGTYTMSYSLMMFYFGALIAFQRRDRKKGLKRYAVILPILAFIVSGCNYIIVMFSMLATLSLALIMVIRKDKKYIMTFVAFAIVLSGMIVSAVAPGNAVRAAQFERMAALPSILISFPAAVRAVLQVFTSVPILIGVLTAVILVSRAISHEYKDYEFKRPWFVFLLSWAVFSATFTPTYFAMYGDGMDRIDNLRMFMLMWLVLVNVFYIMGYFQRSFERYCDTKGLAKDTLYGVVSGFVQKHKLAFAGIICLVVMGSFYCTDIEKVTSYSATKSLLNGEAKQYKAEHLEREKLYVSDAKEVYVKELSVKPYVIYFWDIDESETLRYPEMEVYYDKDLITIDR